MPLPFFFFFPPPPPPAAPASASFLFDDWLIDTLEGEDTLDEYDTRPRRQTRLAVLAQWEQAPCAQVCQPPGGASHFLPLLVVAGAARGAPGHPVFDVSTFEYMGVTHTLYCPWCPGDVLSLRCKRESIIVVTRNPPCTLFTLIYFGNDVWLYSYPRHLPPLQGFAHEDNGSSGQHTGQLLDAAL